MALSDAVSDPEWVRSIVSPALDGLEMVEARFVSHAFPLHAHDEYVIGAVVEGAKQSRHGQRDLTINTGSLTLFNPYEEHTSGGLTAAWKFVAFYPRPSLLEEWLGPSEAGSAAHRFSDPTPHDTLSARLIARLFESTSRLSSRLDVQSAFGEALSHVMERHTASGRGRGAGRTMLRVRDYLHDNLETDVGLTELARLEGVSATTILRRFRRTFGCTPRVYVTARRIARAKRMLKTGFGSAQIAAELCFCDQAHFIRVFTRWTGMTPGRFARES
jgi:AraC-like DNA-binding protein